MKKFLALLLALLLVLGMFAACGPNDEGETDKNDEEQTEAKGDEETDKESEKESEKETDKGSDEGTDNGSNTETPTCTHPDADKTYTSVDATNHKVTCKCGATVAETEAHAYDDDADMNCNKCNYNRTPAACTHADTEKTYTKIDATNHKVTCSCGTVVAETEAHTYANDTTAKCDKCDYTRCVNHADTNGDFVCDTANCGVVVEPAAGELTLAQAKALGALKGSALTTNKYILSGTITKVERADLYGNITITDGTDEILIYGTYDATGETQYGNMTEKPGKGDTMVVSGHLTSYNSVGQMKNGWITSYEIHTCNYAEGVCTICGGSETPCVHANAATFISDTKCYVNCECSEKGLADHSVGTDTVCDMCGYDSARTFVAPVPGTAYNFGMVQGANSISDVYYLTGEMGTGSSSFYMATTKDVTAATKVYVEATNGGYYLYCLNGTDKTYINMVVSGTHVNGAYEATASTVYTFDNKTNTFIASVTVGENTNDYRFGTRNDKTYTTVGPVTVASNAFFCQFYAAETTPVCEHTNKTYINNGINHTWTCANTECGATDTEAHATEGLCACSTACEAAGHNHKTYTNNGADHSWACTCGAGVANEDHATEGTCACSTACEAAGHNHKTCTNTGNVETHTWECTCGLSGTEGHDFDGMICKDCGFDNTPTGTCAHDEYNYVNNNDGTHTATCKNVDCDNETGRTFTENHNYVDGACDKCDAVCPHDGLKTYVDNSNGTHAEKCEICKFVINENAGDHNFEGGACTDCGAVCAHPGENYTNNGDGTHTQTCSCGASFEAEGHTYDDNTCVCGAKEYETVTITEANAKPDNTKVLVSGIVVKTESNKSATIIDKDGNSLYAFKLAEAVALGDYITIKGAMGTYKNSRQIAQGATVTIETEIPEALKIAYEIYMLPIILEFYKDSSIDLPTNGSKFTDVAFTYSVPYEDCLDLEGNTLNMDIDSASNSGYIEVTATYGTTEVTASKGYTIRKMEFTSLSQANITDNTSTDFLSDGTAVNVKGIVSSVEGNYTYIIDANGTKLLIYKSATPMSVGKYYIVSGKMGTYNGRQLATGATAFEETAPKDYMARYLLNSLMATIPDDYNGNLTINVPNVDGYSWEIMGQPVDDVFEMDQDNVDIELYIVIKYGEGEGDILEDTKTVIFKGTAEDADYLAKFEFGDNVTENPAHDDNNNGKLSGDTTYSSGSYSLVLTAPTNVYDGACDAKGNSCLKLGTSSAAASFTFTVGADVNKVVIRIAKYKAKTSKVSINGETQTLTKNSDNGEYDVIEVDTTTNKEVTITTVSGGYRAMIDSITFMA